MESVKEKMNAEKVKEMLEEKGVSVSLVQAESILKFLRMLADIVVSDHMKKSKQQDNSKIFNDDEDSRSIHSGKHRRAS